MNRTVSVNDGIIVSMNDKREVFRGSVLIENNKIVQVERNSSKLKADEEIDARGSIVTPGFICSHTHLYGILLRGAPLKLMPPSDFTQNLQRIWWPMDETMNGDDAYISALTASLELLRTGTTTFADTFSGPNAIKGVLDRIENGVLEAGIRGFISFEATQRRSEEEGYQGLEENERYIKKAKDDKMSGMVSIHASFTVHDDLLKAGKELSDKYSVPLTIHTSEGKWDLYHNLERYGKRTFERLYDLGILGKRTLVAHAVQVNEDELDLIARTGTSVAHNALSNMLNAVGIAPVPEMFKLGINVSIGNDGYIFDAFENIRATYLIHKVNKLDPRVMSFLQVLEMSTVNAAKSLGIHEKLGSVEVGKLADLVIIKPSVRPTPLNESSAYGYLVNSVNGKDVDTVIVNGEVLLKGGKFVKIDIDKVNTKAEKIVSDYWRRLANVTEKVEVLGL
ncbi:MAG: amidohydrolase family protein [Nitrososphaeria archaeon]|nr:amidohydrolase [Conexivisphaerales archaeon]